MKNLFLFLTLLVLSVSANAQQTQTQQDSTKTQKLDEVLVKAVRVKATSPITHTNVKKEEIAKRNLGQDLPILLNYLPSVVSSSDAGAGIGYTYLRVRGSDASRVNITINGIPYNDAESQETFWVNLGDFASSTQSIQLQRGVGTSTNGSSAFGASLNMLTDAISDTSYGEISNSFGSFGTRKHTVKLSSGLINDNVEIVGRFSNIYSDGYVDRAYTDLKSYFLQASYIDDNTLIKALTFGGHEKTYQAWYGLSAEQLEENRRQNPYTYDNEIDDYKQDHYQFHWNERLNDNWSTNLGLNYTHGEGFFEQFKDDRDAADYNNLINDGSDVIVRRWLDNDFYVVNFNTNYKSEKLDLTSGISYSNYKGDHFGEVIWGSDLADGTNIRDRYYFSDATKNDLSFFSKADFEINSNLTAFIDLQGRFVSYETQGLDSDRSNLNIDESFSFFNPKFGMTYLLNNNNSLYASYARANREPSRTDFTDSTGDVKHETLNDFEFGWRFKNEKLKFNANVYYMVYNNQLMPTGTINDVGEYLRENVDDSYRLGLELDANYDISEQLNWSVNATLSQNKIKDLTLERDGGMKNFGTTNMAFSPNTIIGNTITYKPVKNLQLSFLSKFVGEQYLSNTDTESSKLDSYFVSDFNIAYSLKLNKVVKSIDFYGLVNNIFNKEYVDRGYTYLDFWSGPTSTEIPGYFPQATINFLLGATIKF